MSTTTLVIVKSKKVCIGGSYQKGTAKLTLLIRAEVENKLYYILTPKTYAPMANLTTCSNTLMKCIKLQYPKSNKNTKSLFKVCINRLQTYIINRYLCQINHKAVLSLDYEGKLSWYMRFFP